MFTAAGGRSWCTNEEMEYGVMESIREATERAAAILEENNYTALSTADEKGPWAAVVAYAAAAPNFLYFVSQRDSRHAKAVAQAPAVSGVIYNSSTEPERKLTRSVLIVIRR